MTQFGVNPLINPVYAAFHQSLILRLANPGGCYNTPVMVGKVFKYMVDIRLVFICFDYGSLQIVRYQYLGRSP